MVKMMNNEINTGSIQEISTNTDIREQILNTYFKPNVLKDAQHDIIRMSKIANEIEDLLVKRVKGKEEPTEKELTEKISSYSRTSKEIYDKNINSGWPFDVLYMYIIDGIQRFDDYKLDIEKVAETAREIYEKTNQKSLVVANFFDILFSLSQVQMAREETEKLDATIEEGKKLIEVTANVPLSTVINWIIEYLLEYEYSENDVDGVSGDKVTGLHLDNTRKIKIHHLPIGTYSIKEKNSNTCEASSNYSECVGYYYPEYK